MPEILNTEITSRPETVTAEIVTSSPTVDAEIETRQSAVAASLSELRYLVYQGMIGETGQSAYALAVELGFEGSEEDWIASLKGERGETLGWDVTDDGEGNVEMTYPDGVINSQKSVLFEEQTLTTAQKAQARENIGAASASDVYDLNDTVDEHDEDIFALETLSENQASSENVLELAARGKDSDATAAGMGFTLNNDGTFSISGTNTQSDNAIFYTSAAGVASASALKPPAGVYRLEISADQAADFTAVWGVLYIRNANQYVVTDAVGQSAEIYLDGNTPVSSGIVVGSGKNANGLKLTIALRRIGTPEFVELLVDQIDKMRALQRKTLGVTRVLRTAFNTAQTVSAHSQTLETATFSLPLADDANNVVSGGSICFARYGGSTTNTPYKQGISSWQQGAIASISSANGNNVFQLAAPAGGYTLFTRRGTFTNGAMSYSVWHKVLLDDDYTALDQRISALEGG